MNWRLMNLFKSKKDDSFSLYNMNSKSDIGGMVEWSGTWGKIGKWVRIRGNESVDEGCSEGRLRKTVMMIN